MRIALCGTLAAFSAALGGFDSAQAQSQTIVSPTSVGAGDGIGGSNIFPWGSTAIRRYMQLHSDLKGSVKVINKLAWRRDGPTAGSANVRPLDLELYMGSSREYDNPSYVLAQNYLGAPTLVVTRQIMNLGPCSTPGSPAPFEIQIPLTTPYVYTGATAVAWEVVCYSATGPVLPAGDVHTSLITSGTASTLQGAGCIASGRTTQMTLTVTHADTGGIYHLGGYVLNAPSNAPTVLAIGSSNLNLSVPGLCGNIYTDLLAIVSVGLTDANGALRNGDETANYAAPSMIFVAPNTFGGTSLYLQAHSLDLGSSNAIPVANSDGRSLLVPLANNSRVAQATRLFNNAGGTAATKAIYFNTSTIGYAQVTEFTY